MALNYVVIAGLILCMLSANERRRYNATSSLIGWAHTRNDGCIEPAPCSNTARRASIRRKVLYCIGPELWIPVWIGFLIPDSSLSPTYFLENCFELIVFQWQHIFKLIMVWWPPNFCGRQYACKKYAIKTFYFSGVTCKGGNHWWIALITKRGLVMTIFAQNLFKKPLMNSPCLLHPLSMNL